MEGSEMMRMRTFLAFFHLLNFLIMVLATIYLLNSLGGQIEAWRLPLYSYYLIMGLSGAAIAYWIAIDGKRLEHYSANIEELEKKLQKLEQKIKIMKIRISEKK
jgi:predicted membrane protein